ncbi:MAG: peptidylprolyl isomerase [Faecousia sp.]
MKLWKRRNLAAALTVCLILLFAAGCSVKYEAGREKQEIESEKPGISEENEADAAASYAAVIEVADYGTITIALDAAAAPKTVANFVSLAREGFYDGLTFHRIIDGFMIQGGDPNGDGTGGSDQTIPGEFSSNGVENNLSHTRGAVSMARSDDYDSASSQFFIVHQNSTYLDGNYAVFGYVTDGMDVVDAICAAATPTDNNGSIAPEEQPVITSIIIKSS